jgi:hypothetical protein
MSLLCDLKYPYMHKNLILGYAIAYPQLDEPRSIIKSADCILLSDLMTRNVNSIGDSHKHCLQLRIEQFCPVSHNHQIIETLIIYV